MGGSPNASGSSSQALGRKFIESYIVCVIIIDSYQFFKLFVIYCFLLT